VFAWTVDIIPIRDVSYYAMCWTFTCFLLIHSDFGLQDTKATAISLQTGNVLALHLLIDTKPLFVLSTLQSVIVFSMVTLKKSNFASARYFILRTMLESERESYVNICCVPPIILSLIAACLFFSPGHHRLSHHINFRQYAHRHPTLHIYLYYI
jgi:hypothetical protein